MNLRRWSSQFLAKLREDVPRAAILMYHRIAASASDPWRLCVSPRHFREQLEGLREIASITTLTELLRLHKQKQRPNRLVAITFDDGYADNLLVAKPLLEQYEIPATIFLTAGALGSQREFWWDELERVFLQTRTLPASLKLRVVGEPYHWELGESADYSEDQRRAHQSWKAGQPPPTMRQKLYHVIWGLLRPLPHSEQRQVLNQLLTWAKVTPDSRESHRSLTALEAVELGRGELIKIGAHTTTHPELSAHPRDVQQAEIRESRDRLHKLLGTEITQFAYPYGDYSPETVEIVRELGYDLACSTMEQTIRRDVRRYKLPRFQVQDWSGEEFRQRLQAMFRNS